jgi:RDD family
MNCEKCGEVCDCLVEPPPTLLSTPDAVADDTAGAAPQEGADDGTAWRDELSARLNRYRSRHKAPPPRYPSLRLPFDVGRPAAPVENTPGPAFEPISTTALALDGVRQEPEIAEPQITQAVAPTAALVPRSVAHQSAKIIEFPRFSWAPPPPPPDQLAEPVFDRPRILDVPEAELALPALGGITIEPAEVAEVEKRLGIDIPLQSAPLGLRLVAALVDGSIIASASVLFGFIFWKLTAASLAQVQMFTFVAVTLCVFWIAYQYLLIVYSANTPGLRFAHLELTRFDGSATSRSLRRWRVLASCLSAVSLGMGYAWIFLDEDALCWHDRITHTYLAPKAREREAHTTK